MPHDHEMRGFMIAASNMFSYINGIWYADAVWRTAESPKFRPGFIAASSFGVAMIVTSIVVSWLEKRDSKRRFADESDLETSNVALGEEKSVPVLVVSQGEVDGVKRV
jgi:hypothetical protein